MTEMEWLECANPQPMLDFLLDKASDRKLRLFGVACCRGIWDRIDRASMLKAVLKAEEFADGRVPLRTLEVVHQNLDAYYEHAECESAHAAVWCASRPDLCLQTYSHAAMVDCSRDNEPRLTQAALLRCIIGNPFRAITVDLTWRTPLVMALSTTAYNERIMPEGYLETDRLAVLADALEDTGCADAEILSHLHGPGPHVRGCFALDLILDKK